ncbi:hypothetical protein AB0H17_22735 [Streptomyces olivoreticuli]
MTTDLSLLTTAAAKWETAAKDFETVQKTYDSQVRNVAADGSWKGVAADHFLETTRTQTYNQYTAASTEARAIASLLRDAHGQFTELRGRIKSAVAEAAEKHIKIDENGIAKSTQQFDAAARHDPDYRTALSVIAQAEEAWTQLIAGLVRAADDADQGVKLALQAAVQDTDLTDGFANGFNAKAEGDIEKVEAKKAAELATKLGSKGHLDTKEMAELERLFRDNSENRTFSRTLLDNVGADGTIQLSNKLNDLASSDKSHKQDYLALQGGLATSVSAATNDPKSPFYEKWREELRKVGTKNFGSKTDPVYGYQSFVGLMEHHGRYGKQFLNDLGDDIIATEKKDKDVWTQWRKHPGTASDPLDHLLGVMSKNPDAATSFLDPGAEGKNDHLQYLLKGRNWPKVAMNGPGMLSFKGDPDSKAGLGLAIEAASTGHEPLPDDRRPNPEAMHSQAQMRVMHDTIELIDPNSSSAAPTNLQRPLAKALAEYTTDTHEILSGNTDYPDHNGIWKDDGKLKMSVDRDKLLRTTRGLSEDPNAYGTLHYAESQHISNELDKVSPDAKGYHQQNPLRKAGAVLGAYNAIREDVLNDERAAGYSAADWKAKVAYHILGGALTPVTIGTGGFPIGDSLQRGVDTWAWEWSNNMKAHQDAETNAKIADHYMEANHEMRVMIKDWAKKQHLSADSTDAKEIMEGMTDDVMTGATRGNQESKPLLK